MMTGIVAGGAQLVQSALEIQRQRNGLALRFIELSGAQVTCGGDVIVTNASLYVHAAGASAPVFAVGGDVGRYASDAASAVLRLYGAPTNASTPDYGALLIVTGTVTIASNAWLQTLSNPTNGGSPFLCMANLTVHKGGGIDATAGGFAGGLAFGGGHYDGYGPGGGKPIGGGGYGGKGGDYLPPSYVGGPTYGSSNAPIDAGSGGRIAVLRVPYKHRYTGTFSATNGVNAGMNYLGEPGTIVFLDRFLPRGSVLIVR